jgi:cytochrome P450
MTNSTGFTAEPFDVELQPHFAVDPFDVELQQDPVPAYSALREAHPVYKVPSSDLYLVLRYDLIDAVLRDPETFSNRFGQTAAELPPPSLHDALTQVRAGGWAPCPTMSTEDPPAHDHYRAIATPFFAPNRIAEYEKRTKVICAELIQALPTDEPVEFQTAFGDALPIRVISYVMNLDEHMLPTFKKWTQNVTAAVGAHVPDDQRLEAERGIVEMQHYFAHKLDQASRQPSTDWFSALNAAQFPDMDAPRPLRIEEKLSLTQQVFVGGIETTTKLLAETLRLLAQQPAAYDALRTNPASVSKVVEEMLRLSTPAQGLFRIVTKPTELGGVPLPEGSRIVVMYAAANYEPAMFTDPDTYNPNRANLRRHLAFGRGTHFCLGAPLTRMEGAVALNALAAAFPRISLPPGMNKFEYQPSFVLRGLKELWLTFSRMS